MNPDRERRDDPDAIADSGPERAAELFSRAERVAGTSRVELYHRRTTRVRVAREPWTTLPSSFGGCEEGIAVRLADSAGRWSFGASSGGGTASLLWAIEAARRSGPIGGGSDDPRVWGAGDGRFRSDVDEAPPPDQTALLDWLDAALGTLARSRSRVEGGSPSGWIEAGRTVEILVGHGGLATLRSRTRIWAMGSADRGRPPRTLAARRLASLSTDGWAEPDVDRAPVVGEGIGPPRPVLFEGRAACELVRYLATVVHGKGASLGTPVGPGWRVADDPRDPEGLAGGSFDDTGFSTTRRVLSDGRQVVGTLEERGHSWRPSFRDPPETLFTTLSIPGERGEIPPKARRIGFLRVHRLTPARWVLETPGPTYVEADPRDLVRRCLAAFGPPRRLLPGVSAPSLLFDR